MQLCEEATWISQEPTAHLHNCQVMLQSTTPGFPHCQQRISMQQHTTCACAVHVCCNSGPSHVQPMPSTGISYQHFPPRHADRSYRLSCDCAKQQAAMTTGTNTQCSCFQRRNLAHDITGEKLEHLLVLAPPATCTQPWQQRDDASHAIAYAADASRCSRGTCRDTEAARW